MVTNWVGQVVNSSNNVSASHFKWYIEDVDGSTTIKVTTESLISNGVVGQEARIFIIYRELPSE